MFTFALSREASAVVRVHDGKAQKEIIHIPDGIKAARDFAMIKVV